MVLRLIGMGLASIENLSSVNRAIVQEMIDVLPSLNALRAGFRRR